MKRKAEVIDLDADEVFDGYAPYFFNSTSDRDIRHLPHHRLASLALSDSSRTLSPEPQRFIHQSSPLENKASFSGHEIIDLDQEVTQTQSTDLDKIDIINIEELEFELENDILQAGIEDEVALTERNAPIRAPLRKMDMVSDRYGAYLRPGQTVELKDGRFLHIKIIVENVQSKAVVLRGWELRRTKALEGELMLKLNELCYIFEMDLDDPRPMREQCVIEASLKDIKKVRRLTQTNLHFPALRFNFENLPPGDNDTKRKYAEENKELVVRWQQITAFRTAKDRERQFLFSANYTSRKLVRLDKKECDDKCYVPLFALRYQWRGDAISEPDKVILIDDFDGKNRQTNTRVSINVSSHDFDKIDPWKFVEVMRSRYDTEMKLKEQNRKNTKERRIPVKKKCIDVRRKTTARNIKRTTTGAHKYSYADAFCGAGGATRGATMAGLRAVWGLDFNPNAAETWRYNFPQAEMHQMWADELCSLPDPEGKLIVDVLHLSPPCQVWSPAHTRAGKDDEMNFASLYAVQEIISKTKPRIVTLEQTFGIIHQRFRDPFNNLIRMFTDHNFSVSWQIVELERLGLPQRRKRLIIIAAAPGETLPPFPEYTHSRDGGNGLRVFESAQRALSSIPPNAANHEIPHHSQGRYIPWDPSTILPNCITTGGANGRGHPSGLRGLTCREVASLQTFSHNHVFRGKNIRKQIGNAVPPLIGKLIFSSVKKHLEKFDAEGNETLEE